MDKLLTDQRPDLSPQQIDNLNGSAQLLGQEDLPPALRPHVERLASELQSQPMSEVVAEDAVVNFAEQRETSEINDHHQRAEISPAHHQKHLEVASFIPNIENRPTEEQDIIGEVVEIGQEASEGDDINLSKQLSAQNETSTKSATEILGFKKGQNFSKRAEEVLSSANNEQEHIDYSIIEEQLSDLGIDINPRALRYNSRTKGIDGYKYLQDVDKDKIRTSKEPTITIWGLTHLRAREADYAESGKFSQRHEADEYERQHELALLSSLGLVHGTSYDALVNALNDGTFKPNKSVNDSSKGNTHFFDRDLGLDNYVFADYGRPHAYRRKNPPEVEVVFDLSAFDKPGSFATEKDIADCSGVAEYLSTAVEKDYFLEAVQQKLATTVAALPGADIIFGHHLSAAEFASGVEGDPTTLGTNNFSTWEVKVPSIDIDKVKKIIFHDQDQYNEFIAQHGSTYDADYVTRGEAPDYYDKEDVVKNEEDIASRSAQQYDEIVKAKLAEIPEADKEIVWVATAPPINKLRSIRLNRALTRRETPYLAAQDRDGLVKTIATKPVIFWESTYTGSKGYEKITDDNNKYLVVQVERSKSKPYLARFVNEPELIAA